MDIKEAKRYLMRQQQQQQQQQQSYRLGLTFLEDNRIFWGMSNQGQMHLYHYLEFLLYAYKILHPSDSSSQKQQQQQQQQQQQPFQFQLQWIHVPYMLRDQIKGSKGINQLIASLTFQQPSSSSTDSTTNSDAIVAMKGLEDNDDILRNLHDSFRGNMPWVQLARMIWFNFGKKDGWMVIRRQSYLPASAERKRNFRTMTNDVDVVMFVDRTRCDHQEPVVNQMLAKLTDEDESDSAFPAQSWYDAVGRGLGSIQAQPQAEGGGGRGNGIVPLDDGSNNDMQAISSRQPKQQNTKKKLVVCYIDRQSSSRRMPPTEHEWLIQTLLQEEYSNQVDFQHLFMEQLSAIQQIKTARNCNMLVGVHGNGLSHQVWMKPTKGSSYVVEFFWGDKTPFVYCYSLLARIMRHNYLGFWKGRPLDTGLVFGKDPIIPASCRLEDPTTESSITRRAFLEFLNRAIIASTIQKDDGQGDDEWAR